MKNFIIFDLEATCYMKDAPDGFFNEIIEIGAIKIDSTGKEIDRFSKFLKPLKFPYISDFCTELTTITQTDIDNAPDAKSVLQEFLDFIDKDSLLVSWGYYDINQLTHDLKLNRIEHQSLEHRSFKHDYAKINNFTGKRKNGIGVKRALQNENMEFVGQHHRGIDDAINIKNIFLKYIDLYL